MSLKSFPKESLIPNKAFICRSGDGFYIQIYLRPFLLDGETVETEFRFDSARLPDNTQKWAHQDFTFPPNPEDGYVDGSIYICHAHNPADVTRIKFGKQSDDTINAEFFIHLDFEFEGTGFQNTDVQISVPLLIEDT